MNRKPTASASRRRRGDHDRVGVREVRRQVARRFERVVLALGVRLEVLEAVERVELAVTLVPQHRRAVDEFVVEVQQELLVVDGGVEAVVDERGAETGDGAVDRHQRDVDVVRIGDGVAVAVAVLVRRGRLGGHRHQRRVRERLPVGVE
ncbi:hypothetical protein BRD10_04945 [Halobacteriales archaeon SW_12_71_31]|nr:MAG: hypothetical protein BRD10_04945 [Halobacteriales archaeon SW_12_71_31]